MTDGLRQALTLLDSLWDYSVVPNEETLFPVNMFKTVEKDFSTARCLLCHHVYALFQHQGLRCNDILPKRLHRILIYTGFSIINLVYLYTG